MISLNQNKYEGVFLKLTFKKKLGLLKIENISEDCEIVFQKLNCDNITN